MVDLLSAKNSDALIRDLAVTISQRGVVFLRNQDVTPQQMRELMERITVLAGSVCTFTLVYTSNILTLCATARFIRPTCPPSHRRRKRARRSDQRDQLRKAKEGRRIDTPAQRHQPLCKRGMAFGYHLRDGTFRLCDAEDPHTPEDRW